MDIKPDQVAFGSAIFAGISAVVSVWAGILSRKSLRLAQTQDARRYVPLDIYLVDSFAKHYPSYRLCSFDLTITNAGDTANTIRYCQLALTHRLPAGVGSSLVLDHDNVHSVTTPNTPSLFRLPVFVDAHSAVTGRAQFQVPSAVLTGEQIESYTVQLIDVYGSMVTKDALFVNERPDG